MSTPAGGRPVRRPVTLLALCVAAFIISLDVTIVNVALPSLVGLAGLTRRLDDAATMAFLHSFAGGCLVAGGVAAAGAIVAVSLLPARPSSPGAMPRTQELSAVAASTPPR